MLASSTFCSTISPSRSPLLLSLILIILALPLFFVLALLPKTLPAIPSSDELDDLALFRRATLTSPDARLLGSPGRRTPPPSKVAFLFLTNSDLSFAPLWERFFRGSAGFFNVYVHADPTASVASPGGVFHGRFIPAKPTQRASPTLISATRRLLAAALIDDPANAFFALVSQHCIPIHSFRFAYRAIFGAANDADRGRRPRHQSFIETIARDPVLWDRYVARGDKVMLPEVSFEQFRVGSQFFVLTRKHAVMVVRDRRLWNKFRMPCLKSKRESCYPEEHYFPTLLSMEDPAGCTGYTLTRVNWTGSFGGHPHTYRPGEVTADLVKNLRRHSNGTYSYLFARKFSPDSLDLLMELSDSVIFRD